MMRGQRCDVLTPKGPRCRCVVARENLSSHTACTGFGVELGVVCENHWKVIRRGREIVLRDGVRIFTKEGILHNERVR